MAKKKSAVFLNSNYPTKLKFKKFFLPRSIFKGTCFTEVFSYSKSSFSVGLKINWKKLTFNAFKLSNAVRLNQPYKKIIFRATGPVFVNENTLKGLKRLLAPYFRGKRLKKISSIFIPVRSNFTFTKKPSAVRIGGGVGKKPRLTGFFLKSGQPLLTIYTKRSLPILRRLHSLRKKFSTRFNCFCLLQLFMIFKNSKIRIVDNTGAKFAKYIGSYKFNILHKYVGSIFITSLKKVVPRKKLKKGALFRAFTIRVRFPVFRIDGMHVSTSANRAILFKGADNIPITNRLRGYVMLEVFFNPLFQFPNITVYTL